MGAIISSCLFSFNNEKFNFISKENNTSLFHLNNQSIYVNRGFGFLGYQGRVGILPEITILNLEST